MCTASIVALGILGDPAWVLPNWIVSILGDLDNEVLLLLFY